MRNVDAVVRSLTGAIGTVGETYKCRQTEPVCYEPVVFKRKMYGGVNMRSNEGVFGISYRIIDFCYISGTYAELEIYLISLAFYQVESQEWIKSEKTAYFWHITQSGIQKSYAEGWIVEPALIIAAAVGYVLYAEFKKREVSPEKTHLLMVGDNEAVTRSEFYLRVIPINNRIVTFC